MPKNEKLKLHRGKLAQSLLLGLDVCAAEAALLVSCLLTLPGASLKLAQLINALPFLLLSTAVASGAVFYIAGLSRRFWRFVSIADLLMIVATAAIATTFSYAAAMAILPGDDRLPAALFLLHWLLSIAGMSSMRVACRFAPHALSAAQGLGRPMGRKDSQRVLIAGTPDVVDALLRQIEIGVINDIVPVGILDETEADVSRIVRGVPILGRLESATRVIKELRAKDMGPERVVLASSRQAVSDPRYISLASAAANLEIPVSHGIDQAWGRDEGPSLREFDMSELLGRAPARLDAAAMGPALRGKRILVTGAGGTIGSELVRQIAGFQPEKLTLVDTSEYNLYKINQELSESFQSVAFEALLCDVRDRRAIFKTVETQRPELVFHAAALKHVPLVELNASIGAATNIIGTKNVADAVKEFGAKAMVQVSTDKAVNPMGMMGATKRVAELYCQMLDMEGGGDAAAPRFMTVRFGNVLDSSGSVIPLFRRQLRERMPLTVTHPEMTRYFMTIHEAVALILQSTQQAFEKNTERGLVFVLDMGEPIRIVDMAHRMIRLSGLQPGRDVKIQFVGARPGEKMHESLFDSDEGVMPSRVPGVFEARSKVIDPRMLCAAIEGIEDATSHHRDEDVRQMIMGLLQGREAFGAAAPAGAGRESLPADGLELAEFPATQSAPMAVATAARTRKAHLGVVK